MKTPERGVGGGGSVTHRLRSLLIRAGWVGTIIPALNKVVGWVKTTFDNKGGGVGIQTLINLH